MKTGPSYRYKLVSRKPKRKTSHGLFDGTLQKTQIWLNDLMSELDWEDKPDKAYFALRTVLHALRDRLTVEEAVQLGAQLRKASRARFSRYWNSTPVTARSPT